MDRANVMFYTGLGATVSILGSGMAYDVKMPGMTIALGLVAVGCVVAAFLAYLTEPSS